MTRFTFLILLLFLLIGTSCTSRNKKLDRRNLIPEKELTSIITDIYITDGLMTIPKIRTFYSPSDSLSAYKDVIEKHGFTKEVMDKTMKYYYIKNPKELIKIYDQVLATLSEMETRYEKEIALMQVHAMDLWTGENSYSLPATDAMDSASFSIAVKYQGVYTLSFTATLFPEDQSFNPGIRAYVCNPDSLSTGKRTYLKSVKYIKDGQPHKYLIVINCSDRPKHQLRGFFYGSDNSTSEHACHLLIEDISYNISGAI